MEVGESWSYRVRDDDPLVEVRVLRIGTRRPPRVLVRFVPDEFEGYSDWVPRSRLKSRWSEREAHLEVEARWRAIKQPVAADDLPAYYAAIHVFDELIDPRIAITGRNSTSGASWIHDVDGLAALVALPRDDLESSTDSLRDGSDLVVPWSVTRRLAERAAALHPDRILGRAHMEENGYRHLMAHGQPFSGSPHVRAGHVEVAQFVRELDRPENRPCWQQLREWCGVAASAKYDDVEAIRHELRRVVLVAQEAVVALQRAGRGREAKRIEQLLIDVSRSSGSDADNSCSKLDGNDLRPGRPLPNVTGHHTIESLDDQDLAG